MNTQLSDKDERNSPKDRQNHCLFRPRFFPIRGEKIEQLVAHFMPISLQGAADTVRGGSVKTEMLEAKGTRERKRDSYGKTR